MSGVTDDRLIEVSDFDFNVSLCARDRTQIAQMTVAANPFGGPAGTRSLLAVFSQS